MGYPLPFALADGHDITLNAISKYYPLPSALADGP